MTRDEHLEWCKVRAREYLDRGDSLEALTSMMSDLEKHPETANHAGSRIGIQLMMIGKLNSVDEARKFIEGYR